MPRTAFHIHTRYSHDSFLGKWALLLICKIRKVDCLAITDHNKVDGAMAYKEFLSKYGVDVIVGEEIFTTEGEIIGLFLSSEIERGLTPEQTIEEIRKQDGVVYLPHPYDEKRYKTVLNHEALKRVYKDIDCGEIHNGRNIDNTYSQKQREIISGIATLPVVGDDAHCFFEVGRNVCDTDAPFDRTSFSEVLKTATFIKKDCIQLSHRITKYVRVMKLISKGDVKSVSRILYNRYAKRGDSARQKS